MKTVLETELPLKIFKRGKVREVYELEDKLLMVATDRISAFDAVLPNGIPHKGRVLTQLSLHWFERTKNIVDNHLITANVDDYPDELEDYRDLLEGRSMLVKKTESIPVECVARGYISGSAWKEYNETGSVCSIKLPSGLKESDKLPEPIFTPATKAESGHDINISEDEASGVVGEDTIRKMKEYTLEIYRRASEEALERGIIIADTKFEFGLAEDIILIDEILTPDSSRFWPVSDYEPGRAQKSFDKQYVRDYLISIEWDREPPAPQLPSSVIEETSKKYLDAYERITGKALL